MIYVNSRYLHTTQMKRLGWDVPTLNIRRRFTFDGESGTMYEWTERDTLDGVSFRAYGTTAWRWAILDANPQYRTEFDIKAGERLLIPSFKDVERIVNV